MCVSVYRVIYCKRRLYSQILPHPERRERETERERAKERDRERVCVRECV